MTSIVNNESRAGSRPPQLQHNLHNIFTVFKPPLATMPPTNYRHKPAATPDEATLDGLLGRATCIDLHVPNNQAKVVAMAPKHGK